ncbi:MULTISPECIES: AraC family transcriptional regulator [unclassified Duganella]|uniref:AraC family transcriptional regulator n=1 Tax=unclassified Duganella TaxID=2636909 RepID=UPI00088509B2|nr:MULTISPECIES: AraC family transcriptional regulator [unclassified Duganella]SDG18756.1 Helix-turn-helix domain-containing protein [Duganella sp. OV458]SDJ29312.1 Helix-turn-helix domain-containing protein [Duganella sp. OV510]
MHTLAEAIAHWTGGQEHCPTAIPNLSLYRRNLPTPPVACLVEPSIVLVAQGAKQLVIGEQAYRYDAERFMVTSLNLPGISQVLEAAPERPCLGLVYKLDLRTITELATHSGLPPPVDSTNQGAAAIGRLTPALAEPFRRLIALLDEPESCTVLAPLIEREIHYRLLLSDQSARLRQIAATGSQSFRIARVLDWLRNNYTQPLRIDELAAHVRMSASNLHLHFRQLTAMSPLQYQKWLRLNEARRLMLNEHLDAASAAFRVGYESPSQFSREYSRQFGAPPRRDIDTMRRVAAPAI